MVLSLDWKYLQINFPSGTRIQVKTGISKGRQGKEHLPFMNVDVQAPPDDHNAAEGLCGNWNGEEVNALRGGDGQLYVNTPNSVSNFTKSWQYGVFFSQSIQRNKDFLQFFIYFVFTALLYQIILSQG